MRTSLTEFFADPRRDKVEKIATRLGIKDGETIPLDIFREAGYSETELEFLQMFMPRPNNSLF